MGRHAVEGSARAKIRAFLDSLPPGAKFSSAQIKAVANIQEFARRLRELRQAEGYLVLGYRDQPDLRTDEYRFVGKEAAQPVRTKVPAELVRRLRTERPYCELCGRSDGGLVPGSTVRKVKLHVHHFRHQARDGAPDEDNLIVLCSYCNEGLSDLTQIQAFIRGEDLLSQLKVRPHAEKVAVYKRLADWLLTNSDRKSEMQSRLW